MKGLVAFSFGLGAVEPNPCNVRLAQAVQRIVSEESEPVVVVAQWEIALALNSLPLDYVVKRHRREGAYLDSNEVMAQAAGIFRRHGVTEVIPVANPFLRLASTKCRAFVRKEGFTPLDRKVGWIGFYPESLQWWTRGPIHLTLYSALQLLTGYHG